MTVARFLELLVPVLLWACALISVRLWIRQRSRPTAWLAASFLTIGVILAWGQITQDESGDANSASVKVLIVLLAAFPYFLARFADSITTFSTRFRWMTNILFLATAVGMVIIRFPDPPEPGADVAIEGPVLVFVLLLLVEWFGLLALAGAKLLGHRRGRAAIVRRRLAFMAGGAFLLGLALVVSFTISIFAQPSATDEAGEQSEASTIASNSLSAASAILFLLGFAPPKALRASWRREDEEQLYNAAIAFMAAEDPEAVTRDIVPRIKDVLGSPGVAILDEGEVVARAGTHVAADMSSVREIPMGAHTLLVQTDPSMPLLNEGDSEFVSRLGVLADLALERARLMQAEKEARTDLEAVNAELESFVYTTSHDLKNPIIAMLGYIDLLKSEYAAELPAEAQRFVDRMQANAAYMEALIRDLLELSRVGRVDVEPDLVDLGALLDGVATDVTNRFPSVTFSRGDLPDLWMNPTRARQLFGNLIENSAKYGGTDVAIEVSAEPGEHGWWHILVADDGKGIPQEYLERVFGVFERLDANKDGGTGMGLAICRRIVEQAGGHIHALPSDTGARFRIDLPASAVPTAPLLAENEEGVLQ
jgi:signal transduction histidine kinase